MTTFLDNNHNDDASTLPEENEKGKCSMCGKITQVKKVNIYYNAGRKMKIAYLCYNIKGNNYTEDNIDNSCYFNYYKDLGLGLTVAGWEDKAYDAVLSVYISTPLWVRKLSSPYSFPTNDNTVPLRKPLDGLSFADARIADKHNPVVRQYFRSVLNEKLKNDEDFLLSPELNPRLWPIRFRMTHLESRVVKTCDEPLTFKWSGHE